PERAALAGATVRPGLRRSVSIRRTGGQPSPFLLDEFRRSRRAGHPARWCRKPSARGAPAERLQLAPPSLGRQGALRDGCERNAQPDFRETHFLRSAASVFRLRNVQLLEAPALDFRAGDLFPGSFISAEWRRPGPPTAIARPPVDRG